jgi:hypothetical protein
MAETYGIAPAAKEARRVANIAFLEARCGRKVRSRR